MYSQYRRGQPLCEASGCPDQEEVKCVLPVVSGFHPYLGSELLGKGGGEHSMIPRTDLLGEGDSTEVSQGAALIRAAGL